MIKLRLEPTLTTNLGFMKDKSTKINTNLLISIYIFVDDVCKSAEKHVKSKWLAASTTPARRSFRKPALTESEVATILIYYHYSGYKNFEYYYTSEVLHDLKSYFPKAPSYTHFLELQKRVALLMPFLLKVTCINAQKTEIYYIDSKKMPVCDNLRISSHKVFQDYAGRGKSSTGWFYGLKAHLVINNWGEIVQFSISSASVADNNQALLKQLLGKLKGYCVGDKGYLTKLWEHFYEQGLKILHKIKRNMKNKIMHREEKYYLAKRGVIESVNDILDSVFDLTHTRHRNPENALSNIFAALVAYQFYPDKPMVFFPKI